MAKRFLKIRRSKPYQYLKDKFLYARAYVRWKLNPYPKEIGVNPIFIFNHIPKCGGTSLNIVLRKWFHLVKDYHPYDVEYKDLQEFENSKNEFSRDRPRITKLKSFQIIAGHYHIPGNYLNNRFPINELGNKVKIITFLRDPLYQRVSAFTYGLKRKQPWVQGVSLNDFIFLRDNLFAKILDCNESNFREKLANYFFIGIVEDYELSINILAEKLNRKLNTKIPNVNQTNSSKKINDLDPKIIDEFRKRNSLDYKIYDFAKQRLLRF